MKQKRFFVIETTYRSGWLLAFGGEVNDAIAAYAKKVKVEPWTVPENSIAGNFSGISTKCGGCIWFKDLKPGAGIVTHETFHATYWFMKQFLEANLTSDTEELYAYFQQYLVSQIARRVW